MTKLSEIADGIIKTFTMDDPRKAQPRKPACRECEIVGSAAMFSGAAYVLHVTRMGRIQQLPGFAISMIMGCFGASLLLSFPPDSETKEVLEWREMKRIEYLKKEAEKEKEATSE